MTVTFASPDVVLPELLNALDACRQGGAVRLSGRSNGAEFELSVSDDGGGIPEAARPYVFDAFYTTKEGGSGLGLSVSREIAMQHGGDLEFESTSAGTTFRLRLPLRSVSS